MFKHAFIRLIGQARVPVRHWGPHHLSWDVRHLQPGPRADDSLLVTIAGREELRAVSLTCKVRCGLIQRQLGKLRQRFLVPNVSDTLRCFPLCVTSRNSRRTSLLAGTYRHRHTFCRCAFSCMISKADQQRDVPTCGVVLRLSTPQERMSTSSLCSGTASIDTSSLKARGFAAGPACLCLQDGPVKRGDRLWPALACSRSTRRAYDVLALIAIASDSDVQQNV